jgi:hypothetical protein
VPKARSIGFGRAAASRRIGVGSHRSKPLSEAAYSSEPRLFEAGILVELGRRTLRFAA